MLQCVGGPLLYIYDEGGLCYIYMTKGVYAIACTADVHGPMLCTTRHVSSQTSRRNPLWAHALYNKTCIITDIKKKPTLGLCFVQQDMYHHRHQEETHFGPMLCSAIRC